jgi:hypothetical protein
MEAAVSSETSVPFCKTTRCHVHETGYPVVTTARALNFTYDDRTLRKSEIKTKSVQTQLRSICYTEQRVSTKLSHFQGHKSVFSHSISTNVVLSSCLILCLRNVRGFCTFSCHDRASVMADSTGRYSAIQLWPWQCSRRPRISGWSLQWGGGGGDPVKSTRLCQFTLRAIC